MSDPEMTTFGMYPEPEPVAWFCKLPDNKISIKIVGKPTKGNWEPLYAAPQKKEWVGLTDEDKKQIEIKADDKSEMTAWEYAQRVGEFTEAKLKEKNT
jgi:hypothetical protein